MRLCELRTNVNAQTLITLVMLCQKATWLTHLGEKSRYCSILVTRCHGSSCVRYRCVLTHKEKRSNQPEAIRAEHRDDNTHKHRIPQELRCVVLECILDARDAEHNHCCLRKHQAPRRTIINTINKPYTTMLTR